MSGYGGKATASTSNYDRPAVSINNAISSEVVESPPKERKRLNLAPRSSNPVQRPASTSQSSIFGEARPREEILASRTGKAESEILEEEALQERLHLKLTSEQLEAKVSLEEKIAALQLSYMETDDINVKNNIHLQIENHMNELDLLIQDFEEMAINTAHEGGGMRPSSRPPKQRGNSRGGRLSRSNSERSGRGRFSNRNEIYRTKSDDLYTRGRGRHRGRGRNNRGRSRGRGGNRGRNNNFSRGHRNDNHSYDQNSDSHGASGGGGDGGFFDNFSDNDPNRYGSMNHDYYHGNNNETFSNMEEYYHYDDYN